MKKNANNIHNTDDSYASDSERKKPLVINKKKEINLFGGDNKNKNFDKNQMYKRLGDLQNLEVHYFKSKDNIEFNISKYNEKFKTFKKKL